MFQRIKRIIASWMNKILNVAEDPKTILENNIREMRNQIPKLNQGVAKAHGTVILLSNQYKQQLAEKADIESKLKAAINLGQDEIGKTMAVRLESIESSIVKTKEALEQANDGLQKLQELRDAQIRKIHSETDKIKDAINNSEISRLKGELASLFESYQVGDISYSNEDMLAKLNEEAAMNEGKLESASKTPDMQMLKLEKEAEQVRATEIYEKYKTQLGGVKVSKSTKTSKKKSK